MTNSYFFHNHNSPCYRFSFVFVYLYIQTTWVNWHTYRIAVILYTMTGMRSRINFNPHVCLQFFSSIPLLQRKRQTDFSGQYRTRQVLKNFNCCISKSQISQSTSKNSSVMKIIMNDLIFFAFSIKFNRTLWIYYLPPVFVQQLKIG